MSWAFEGSDGRSEFLTNLLVPYVMSLQEIAPQPVEDILQQMEEDLEGAPKELAADDLVMQRLFPDALQDVAASAEFRGQAAGAQAWDRLQNVHKVLDDLKRYPDALVEVPAEHLDAWVQTLAALRAQWNVKLMGKVERLGEPTLKQIADDPGTATVCDWLGYLLEDALESKAAR